MMKPCAPALGILLAIGLVMACGDSEPENLPAATTPALVAEGADPLASEEDRVRMEELLALGYLEGSKPAPEDENVLVHDREKSHPGLNLLVSGHGPEAILFDMQGRVLHRWHKAFREVFPDSKKKTWFRGDRYWRRARVLENGDIIVIFDGLGMMKLDKDSNLIWSYDGNTHHDLQVTPDGSIYTLEHEIKILPRIHPSNQVLEDFVLVLDANGIPVRRVSLFESVANSQFAHWLEASRDKGDIFHTNTITLLDDRMAYRIPQVRAGMVLVSIHGLNAVGVVDLDRAEIVWGLQGPFAFQHEPSFVENQNLLVFDNLGGPPKFSRVIELDPRTGEIKWEYQAEVEGEFYSFCCGSAQRLSNGNTLITDTEGGKAFEITPGKEIVWLYRSPFRTGENSELVASLFEVYRLPADFPIDWSEAPQGP